MDNRDTKVDIAEGISSSARQAAAEPERDHARLPPECQGYFADRSPLRYIRHLIQA
jgi:hypothetical protein